MVDKAGLTDRCEDSKVRGESGYTGLITYWNLAQLDKILRWLGKRTGFEKHNELWSTPNSVQYVNINKQLFDRVLKAENENIRFSTCWLLLPPTYLSGYIGLGVGGTKPNQADGKDEQSEEQENDTWLKLLDGTHGTFSLKTWKLYCKGQQSESCTCFEGCDETSLGWVYFSLLVFSLSNFSC